MNDEERQRAIADTKKKWTRIGIKWWDDEHPEIRAYYQLQEPRLLLNFGEFHAGVEKLLGRSVWTHEFAEPEVLLKELETGNRASFAEVLAKLAKYGKPIIPIIVGTADDTKGVEGK